MEARARRLCVARGWDVEEAVAGRPGVKRWQTLRGEAAASLGKERADKDDRSDAWRKKAIARDLKKIDKTFEWVLGDDGRRKRRYFEARPGLRMDRRQSDKTP